MSENKNEFETIDFETETKQEKPQKNIFSDFNTDKSLEADVKKIQNKEDKDMFYYLSISLKVFNGILGILIILICFVGGYVYFQLNNFENKTYLNPICNVFNGDIKKTSEGCSSITYNKNILESKVNELLKKQYEMILKILPVIYERENYLKSKEISFLLEKSENKLKVLDILGKFDYYKNEFTSEDRKKIQCGNFLINSETKILSMKCDALTRGYEGNIIGLEGNKNKTDFSGSSISMANSFINFLEKNATEDFIVVNKQKIFELQAIPLENGYNRKTSFDLKLKLKN